MVIILGNFESNEIGTSNFKLFKNSNHLTKTNFTSKKKTNYCLTDDQNLKRVVKKIYLKIDGYLFIIAVK